MNSASTILTIKQLRLLHVGPIDLALKARQCVGLSGPSGCGKSVLLKAIADLLESDGEITLDNQAYQTVEAPEWRSKVQLVPAESLWWHSTVGEHFQHPIDQTLKTQLSLAPNIETQAVNQLSTGQKQRLALLRALEREPRILLLDEPTASLDKDNTRHVENLINNYLNNNNAAALWVSHDPEQLKRVTTTAFKMISGKLESVTP